MIKKCMFFIERVTLRTRLVRKYAVSEPKGKNKDCSRTKGTPAPITGCETEL